MTIKVVQEVDLGSSIKVENSKVDVKVSSQEGNALSLLEDGLFVSEAVGGEGKTTPKKVWDTIRFNVEEVVDDSIPKNGRKDVYREYQVTITSTDPNVQFFEYMHNFKNGLWVNNQDSFAGYTYTATPGVKYFVGTSPVFKSQSDTDLNFRLFARVYHGQDVEVKEQSITIPVKQYVKTVRSPIIFQGGQEHNAHTNGSKAYFRIEAPAGNYIVKGADGSSYRFTIQPSEENTELSITAAVKGQDLVIENLDNPTIRGEYRISSLS